MLPNATVSQRVATGFHRNTMLNEEGGIDPLQVPPAFVAQRAAAILRQQGAEAGDAAQGGPQVVGLGGEPAEVPSRISFVRLFGLAPS